MKQSKSNRTNYIIISATEKRTLTGVMQLAKMVITGLRHRCWHAQTS